MPKEYVSMCPILTELFFFQFFYPVCLIHRCGTHRYRGMSTLVTEEAGSHWSSPNGPKPVTSVVIGWLPGMATEDVCFHM
jgi:hypothetical protein